MTTIAKEAPSAVERPSSVESKTVSRAWIAKRCGEKSLSWVNRLKQSGGLPKPLIERRDSLNRNHQVEWLRSDIELWIDLGMPNRAEFERRKAERSRR